MPRPTWDEYFSKITVDIAARSTCNRKDRQFGAIIINKQKEIVATGFNGVIRGAPHCEEIGCIKDQMELDSGVGHSICPAVHAEQNALIQAGRNSVGGTLYINAYPCKICARLIANAGIERVVVSSEYSDKDGLEIMSSAGIEIDYINFSR